MHDVQYRPCYVHALAGHIETHISLAENSSKYTRYLCFMPVKLHGIGRNGGLQLGLSLKQWRCLIQQGTSKLLELGQDCCTHLQQACGLALKHTVLFVIVRIVHGKVTTLDA